TLSGKGRRAEAPPGGALRDRKVPPLPQPGPLPLRGRSRQGGSVSARLKWISLAAILLAFAGLYARALEAPPAARWVPPRAAPQAASAKPFFESQLLPNASAASVHSATAVDLADGTLRAFWYGGTREGASDVAIYTSAYSGGAWTPESALVRREEAQRQLQRSLRKLGNPVAGRDLRGRVWLFYVSVSLGGWAGSAINAMVSEDEGRTWSE